MRRGICVFCAAICLLLSGCGQAAAPAGHALQTAGAPLPTETAAPAEHVRREAQAAHCAAAWAVQYAMLPEEMRVLLAHDSLLRLCRYEAAGAAVHSAYGALICGEAVCGGYAEGFRALCTASGIPCVTVLGSRADAAGGALHAWNLVCLRGHWYHIDCTWDDRTEGAPLHTWFLRSDAEMSVRYEWDRAHYPAAEGGTLSYGTIVEAMLRGAYACSDSYALRSTESACFSMRET